MKCPSCNADLPPTAKFCGACGTTLSTPQQPEQSWAPPPPPAEQAWAPPAPAEQAWAPPPPEQAWPPPPPIPQPAYSGGSYGGGTPHIEKRFKALRFIAMLIKIFAFLAGGLFVIAALFMIIAGAATSTATRNPQFEQSFGPQALFGGLVGGLLMLVYGGFVFVFLYAYAEVIYLFLGIEENTRATTDMLRNR